MQQTRFANARLADDVEDLDGGAHTFEATLERLQFLVAADERREATPDRRLELRRIGSDRG